VSYVATFTPQAWIKDYAVQVDPEGPTTWDCTKFVGELDPFTQDGINESIGEEGHWLDSFDLLKGDEAAPQWVKDWQGPFTIVVQYKAK
jgi:hypothetical protein